MKKGKKARLLTMDELHARPCEVDGRPALFHRWIEEDIEKPNMEKIRASAGHLSEVAYITVGGVSVPRRYCTMVRHTFALVEYRDGTIAKVEPERIRFVGREGEA